MSVPRVSIITPCYNSAVYIGRTLDSVRAQTLSEWEQIVVDDGSTDDSAAVVKSYLVQEPRLRLVTQANCGVSAARNRGYAASAPGEYVLFLDADDCPEPAMLETLVGYLDAHPEAGMVYAKPLFVDEADNPCTESGLFRPRYVPQHRGRAVLPETVAETPFLSLFTLCGHLPSLTLLRRSVCAQVGEWDESLGQVYEDTDLFLRMALLAPVHYLPEPLLRYRRHPKQATASGSNNAQRAKLYAKWDAVTDLPPAQQATLREARAFRDGCMVPLSELHAGADCLRSGQWRKALWFFRHMAVQYAAFRVSRLTQKIRHSA